MGSLAKRSIGAGAPAGAPALAGCDRPTIGMLGGCDPTIQTMDDATYGLDASRQGIGGDPYGTLNNFGLLVPVLATPTVTTNAAAPSLRYLFLLDQFEVGAKQCITVRGLRQFWSAILYQPSGSTRYVELPITDPISSFPDGNISWHLRYVDYEDLTRPGIGPLDAPSFKFRWADGPALLYETATFPAADISPITGRPDFYTTLTAYTPPNRGRPWGRSVANLGTFYDLRYPWGSTSYPNEMDIRVNGGRGGGRIMFFASVRQTNPAARTNLTAPSPFYPAGLSPLEQLMLNFPYSTGVPNLVVIGRVAGSIIAETIT